MLQFYDYSGCTWIGHLKATDIELANARLGNKVSAPPPEETRVSDMSEESGADRVWASLL